MARFICPRFPTKEPRWSLVCQSSVLAVSSRVFLSTRSSLLLLILPRWSSKWILNKRTVIISSVLWIKRSRAIQTINFSKHLPIDFRQQSRGLLPNLLHRRREVLCRPSQQESLSEGTFQSIQQNVWQRIKETVTIWMVKWDQVPGLNTFQWWGSLLTSTRLSSRLPTRALKARWYLVRWLKS